MRTGREGIDKRKLIDRLSPDEEFGEYEGFWATTYKMQPEFIETDFLPALLGLGSWNDRHWTTRISMEKKLFEMTSASVLIDAFQYSGRPRSLRVEILPRRGINNNKLHAKVMLAVHNHGVRLLFGSSNLTEQGYRRNIEVIANLSASAKNYQNAGLIHSAIKGAQELLTPWWSTGAEQLLEKALIFLEQFKFNSPKETEWFTWSGGDKSLAQSFVNRWPSGEKVLKIQIVSPFWSDEIVNGPISQFIRMLMDKSGISSNIEVHLYASPYQLSKSDWQPILPISYGSFDFGRIGCHCFAHAVNPEVLYDEVMRENFLGTRDLHAKVVIVEGEFSSLSYLGSANFTHHGWGFLENPAAANIEAGLILLRSGKSRDELLALVPSTIGKSVELHGTSSSFIKHLDQTKEDTHWPIFLEDVRLTPRKGRTRELELVATIKKALVKGNWNISLSEDMEFDNVVIMQHLTDNELLDSYHVELSDQNLNILLTKQQVAVRWWECSEGISFPINVSIEARDELPIAPGCRSPGEDQLIAYYQGRITYEELFPPTDIDESEKESIYGNESSKVDTSGILSYQIRDFVESLEGMRQDLKLASGTERSLRLALLGPVSPVQLARCVFDSLKEGRSPTAAAFQLAEILICISEISVPPGGNQYLHKAKEEVGDYLEEIIKSHLDELGPGTTFQKYLDGLSSTISKEIIF